VRKNLTKKRLRESELKALLRKQGVHSFHEVSTAILEADGTLSITRMNELTHHSAQENDSVRVDLTKPNI
jgi:uncharacterized membrane protein YcaP (DUF421 family)